MLHVRRERTRLLAAFDRALVGPEHRPGAGRRLLWAGTLTVVAACILVVWRVRPARQPVHSNPIVHADSTAVWSERRIGNREVIELARGMLSVHVDHLSGEERLLVVLPDGELEDTGTTFTVSAEDGHATRVAVQEGHVLLRVRGQAAVVIGPGETWTPARPAVSASTSAAPPDDTVAATLDAVERTTPPPSLSAPAASAHASVASVDFRTAMTALDVGDNHQAAVAFANFLERHPRDPRAEDAAYLRVVALQRCGDAAGMREAALEYLHRYPAGFRHAEVDELSR
jgi:hypothetical protein